MLVWLSFLASAAAFELEVVNHSAAAQRRPDGGAQDRREGGTRNISDMFYWRESDWTACARRMPLLSSPDRCINLAPAETGSTTVYHRLLTLCHTQHSHQCRHVVHDHRRRLVHLQKPAECVLMPLRDPAQRLESAWRSDVMASDQRVAYILNSLRGWPPKRGPNVSLSDFVAAFRDSGHASHASVQAIYASSVYQWSTWSKSRGAPSKGSNFLISQAEYLRGLDCAHTAVHFICNERLDEDWMRLLSTTGANASFDMHSRRENRMQGCAEHADCKGSDWRLAGRDAAFVRSSMFFTDDILHTTFCIKGIA